MSDTITLTKEEARLIEEALEGARFDDPVQVPAALNGLINARNRSVDMELRSMIEEAKAQGARSVTLSDTITIPTALFRQMKQAIRNAARQQYAIRSN